MGNYGPSHGLMFLGEMDVHRSTVTSVVVEERRHFVLVLLNSRQSSALSHRLDATLLLLEIVPLLLAVHILDSFFCSLK